MLHFVSDFEDYEMECELKSSEPRDRDRLSELHDSLIFNIFEFLPMKYVVRTQILSHRWKNLWTLTPNLYFQNENDRDNIDFQNIVNCALLSWRGTRVQKFKVSGIVPEYGGMFDYNWEPAIFTDINWWLRFAVDNGVEELDLSSSGFSDEHFYYVPQFLYSCSSLKKLSLSWTNIVITEKAVQWNQLLSLTIQGYGVTARTAKQILVGSPRLEVFNLYFEESDEDVKLDFQSSSLKVLLISSRDDITDIPKDTELRICAPNLKSLTIEGIPYDKCLLENVSSLSHATLWFNALDYGEFDKATNDFNYSSNDYLAETLSQILPAFWRVEGLTLSDWPMKVLGEMNNECMLSPLSNVKFLTLHGGFEGTIQILCLLEIFPKLKTLVVKEEYVGAFYVESKLQFKHPSKFFLKELKTVVVTWNLNDFSIFPLIESLLKYASRLEKMVFRVEEITPPSTADISNSLFLASQKLLRMPRSSPTAELVFCE